MDKTIDSLIQKDLAEQVYDQMSKREYVNALYDHTDNINYIMYTAGYKAAVLEMGRLIEKLRKDSMAGRT